MDENEIMQGTEGVETDGFMDGWEETSPTEGEPEETGAAADGGDQAIFGDAGEAQDQSAAGGDQTGVQQEEQHRQELADRQEFAHRQAANIRMHLDLREFQAVFPEAAQNPQSIPPEVWAEVRNGRSLVGAYAKHIAGQAARRAEIERQNAENASRSMGSMRSAGSSTGPRDPFLAGFDE